VAVLIASAAGHIAPVLPPIEMVLDAPLDPALIPNLEAAIRRALPDTEETAMGTLAYFLSKRRVIKLCEQRAAAWGARGARIVSISPGMIFTPMGRHEAEVDPASAATVTSTPLGRWGTPMEIASVVAFLMSSAAAFITGSDVKVDGGAVGMFRTQTRPTT
jgi:NAD(P)-dependent dehydrogenase (short-subunit alcohol dehydrogenase family)